MSSDIGCPDVDVNEVVNLRGAAAAAAAVSLRTASMTSPLNATLFPVVLRLLDLSADGGDGRGGWGGDGGEGASTCVVLSTLVGIEDAPPLSSPPSSTSSVEVDIEDTKCLMGGGGGGGRFDMIGSLLFVAPAFESREKDGDGQLTVEINDLIHMGANISLIDFAFHHPHLPCPPTYLIRSIV